jgi:hypothetical protein
MGKAWARPSTNTLSTRRRAAGRSSSSAGASDLNRDTSRSCVSDGGVEPSSGEWSSTAGSDPVHDGLVPSLALPGGNVTGIGMLAVQLVPKRLELLSELIPQGTWFS